MLLFVSIQKKGIEVHIAAKPTDKSVIDPISSALLILDIVENPQISPARVNADPAPRRDHPTVLYVRFLTWGLSGKDQSKETVKK